MCRKEHKERFSNLIKRTGLRPPVKLDSDIFPDTHILFWAASSVPMSILKQRGLCGLAPSDRTTLEI